MTKIIAACVQMRSGVEVAPNIAAASALIRLGYDMAPELAQAEAMLARLKAPRGWHECGTGAGIRRHDS